MSSSRGQSHKSRKQEVLPSYTREPVLPTYEDENHDSTVSFPRPQRLSRLLSLQRQEERDLELGTIERIPPASPEEIYIPPELPGEVTLLVPGPALSAPVPHVTLTRTSRARLESAARSSSDEDMAPLRSHRSHSEISTAASAAVGPEAAVPLPENHPELTSASRARLEGAAGASRGEDMPPLRYYWSHPDNPSATAAPETPAVSSIFSRLQIQIFHRVRRSFKAMGAYCLLMTILVAIALVIAVVAW